MPGRRAFADLHAQARRAARRPEEADDLVQSALLAAIESGRKDLSTPETRRWMAGVIRNRAAFDARTAVRRQRRDTAWAEAHGTDCPQGGQSPDAAYVVPEEPGAGLATLTPSLRLTARLALSGHTRREIAWLLDLSDAALRQRISQLKRALARTAAPETGPSGAFAFGRIRRALLGPARRSDAFLASHDPDGHLFVVNRSQILRRRQLRGG